MDIDADSCTTSTCVAPPSEGFETAHHWSGAPQPFATSSSPPKEDLLRDLKFVGQETEFCFLNAPPNFKPSYPDSLNIGDDGEIACEQTGIEAPTPDAVPPPIHIAFRDHMETRPKLGTSGDFDHYKPSGVASVTSRPPTTPEGNPGHEKQIRCDATLSRDQPRYNPPVDTFHEYNKTFGIEIEMEITCQWDRVNFSAGTATGQHDYLFVSIESVVDKRREWSIAACTWALIYMETLGKMNGDHMYPGYNLASVTG